MNAQLIKLLVTFLLNHPAPQTHRYDVEVRIESLTTQPAIFRGNKGEGTATIRTAEGFRVERFIFRNCPYLVENDGPGYLEGEQDDRKSVSVRTPYNAQGQTVPCGLFFTQVGELIPYTPEKP